MSKFEKTLNWLEDNHGFLIYIGVLILGGVLCMVNPNQWTEVLYALRHSG